MMRYVQALLAAFLMTLSTAAGSQTIVDDTAAALSEPERKALFGALLLTAKDPISGQFAKLEKPRPDVVCGLVNLRTAMGGYGGFQPFSFYDGRGHLTIGPSSGGSSPRSAIEILQRIQADCSRKQTAPKIDGQSPARTSPAKTTALNAERVHYGCVEMTNEMLSEQAPAGAHDRIISACKTALLGSPSRANDLSKCTKSKKPVDADEAFMFKHICRAASDLLRKR